MSDEFTRRLVTVDMQSTQYAIIWFQALKDYNFREFTFVRDYDENRTFDYKMSILRTDGAKVESGVNKTVLDDMDLQLAKSLIEQMTYLEVKPHDSFSIPIEKPNGNRVGSN